MSQKTSKTSTIINKQIKLTKPYLKNTESMKRLKINNGTSINNNQSKLNQQSKDKVLYQSNSLINLNTRQRINTQPLAYIDQLNLKSTSQLTILNKHSNIKNQALKKQNIKVVFSKFKKQQKQHLLQKSQQKIQDQIKNQQIEEKNNYRPSQQQSILDCSFEKNLRLQRQNQLINQIEMLKKDNKKLTEKINKYKIMSDQNKKKLKQQVNMFNQQSQIIKKKKQMEQQNKKLKQVNQLLSIKQKQKQNIIQKYIKIHHEKQQQINKLNTQILQQKQLKGQLQHKIQQLKCQFQDKIKQLQIQINQQSIQIDQLKAQKDILIQQDKLRLSETQSQNSQVTQQLKDSFSKQIKKQNTSLLHDNNDQFDLINQKLKEHYQNIQKQYKIVIQKLKQQLFQTDLQNAALVRQIQILKNTKCISINQNSSQQKLIMFKQSNFLKESLQNLNKQIQKQKRINNQLQQKIQNIKLENKINQIKIQIQNKHNIMQSINIYQLQLKLQQLQTQNKNLQQKIKQIQNQNSKQAYTISKLSLPKKVLYAK